MEYSTLKMYFAIRLLEDLLQIYSLGTSMAQKQNFAVRFLISCLLVMILSLQLSANCKLTVCIFQVDLI